MPIGHRVNRIAYKLIVKDSIEKPKARHCQNRVNASGGSKRKARRVEERSQSKDCSGVCIVPGKEKERRTNEQEEA